MKKSRFTEEQIAYVLRQAESGTPVSDVCRRQRLLRAVGVRALTLPGF